MITVREAAEKMVIIQGGGDVDDVAHRLQQQINAMTEAANDTARQAQEVLGVWADMLLPSISKVVDAFAVLSRSIPGSERKTRRRRHIVNALNRVKR